MFTVQGDIASFDQGAFVESIASVLSVKAKSIVVVGVASGSVIVHTRMNDNAYAALLAVNDKQLGDIGVLSMSIDDSAYQVRSRFRETFFPLHQQAIDDPVYVPCGQKCIHFVLTSCS